MRKARVAGAALAPGIILALAPKCPACIAVWLVALGVGTGTAGVTAAALRPIAWALLLVTAAVLAVAWWRGNHRAAIRHTPTDSRP